MTAQGLATPNERRDMDVPELWKVGRVAKVLGLSEPSVYRLMESGLLPYVLFGRCRRVKKADVLTLIERQTIAR
jgi:excisionase family DNA binding protein